MKKLHSGEMDISRAHSEKILLDWNGNSISVHLAAMGNIERRIVLE